jgi:hypothetical protein
VSSKWWGDGRRKKGEEKTTSTNPTPDSQVVNFPNQPRLWRAGLAGFMALVFA